MIDEGCIHSADDIGFPCDSVYSCDTIGAPVCDTLLKRTGLNHGSLPISEINAQWCIGSRISLSFEIYLREASTQWFIPRETINRIQCTRTWAGVVIPHMTSTFDCSCVYGPLLQISISPIHHRAVIYTISQIKKVRPHISCNRFVNINFLPSIRARLLKLPLP